MSNGKTATAPARTAAALFAIIANQSQYTTRHATLQAHAACCNTLLIEVAGGGK